MMPSRQRWQHQAPMAITRHRKGRPPQVPALCQHPVPRSVGPHTPTLRLRLRAPSPRLQGRMCRRVSPFPRHMCRHLQLGMRQCAPSLCSVFVGEGAEHQKRSSSAVLLCCAAPEEHATASTISLPTDAPSGNALEGATAATTQPAATAAEADGGQQSHGTDEQPHDTHMSQDLATGPEKPSETGHGVPDTATAPPRPSTADQVWAAMLMQGCRRLATILYMYITYMDGDCHAGLQNVIGTPARCVPGLQSPV
jgi:hypothetical protein